MSLDKILNAKSVAIIGASKDETKRGYQTIRTLLDERYEGNIYPVNPKEDSILGFKCYKNITDIKDPVDLALIATPARTLPFILADCGKKKVSGAVILAGGFGELGRRGKKLEDEVVAVAKKHHIRLILENLNIYHLMLDICATSYKPVIGDKSKDHCCSQQSGKTSEKLK